MRDGSFAAGSRNRASGGGLGQSPQKLKKHRKLYTLVEKYFVHHMRCQNDETVASPAMLYKGGGWLLINFLLEFASISRVL